MEGQTSTTFSTEARLGVLVIILAILIFPRSWSPIEIHKVPDLPKLPNSSKEIVRGDISKKQVIFTFDGGSGADSADAVLNILAKHDVKGTFFLTGRFIDTHQDLVRRVIAGGHEVFSHTYNHPHLTALTDGEIVSELRKTEQSLEIAVNALPRPYFRVPYGDRDYRVLGIAFREGYQSVYWTVDAGDWEEGTGITANDVRARILFNLAPGNIYLMHLGDKITGEVLDDIFTRIESENYKIVSLTEGL